MNVDHTNPAGGETTTANAIELFANDDFSVRIVRNDDGDPLFVAADICKALGLGNASQALSSLDEDEKGLSIVDTPGGKQSLTCVNEPGLYSLVLRSRKPEAKKFKRWVTHDVLPSIRRAGSYIDPGAAPAVPDDVLHALIASKDAVIASRDALVASKDDTLAATKALVAAVQALADERAERLAELKARQPKQRVRKPKQPTDISELFGNDRLHYSTIAELSQRVGQNESTVLARLRRYNLIDRDLRPTATAAEIARYSDGEYVWETSAILERCFNYN